MNIIILELNQRAYDAKNYLDHYLYTLATFLTDDVGSTGFYKRWFYSSQDLTCGNMTCLEKLDNNIIEISMAPGLDEGRHICLITSENFIQLLNEWEKICINDVPKVILYEENNQFLLSPYREEA